MKVVVKNTLIEERIEYKNVLYKHNCSETIVFAAKEISDTTFAGIVIKEIKPFSAQGTYKEDWGKSYFEPFKGELILSND